MKEYGDVVLRNEERDALRQLLQGPAERLALDAEVYRRLKDLGFVTEYFTTDSPVMLRISDAGRGFLEYDKARRRESRKKAITWAVSVTGGLITAAYYLLQILGN